jgi:superfamily II DNA or RNA helicase
VISGLVGGLTDDAIRRAVGPAVYQRGAAYVQQDRVVELDVRPGGRTVAGLVHGTAIYRAVVRVDPGAVSGTCSCPVQYDCKHVAAVLIAARGTVPAGGRGTAAPRPDWERSVATLLQPVTARATGTPMALQFDLVPGAPGPSYGRAGLPARRGRIRIRPVVPGRNAAWVRTGVSWSGLQYDYASRHVPAHREALCELYRASQASAAGYYYAGDSAVHLDDVGPGLWRLLEQVVDAGVPLVPARAAMGPVRLHAVPAEVAVDLRRAAPSGDVTLEPVVTLDGVPLPAPRLGLIGDPAHGLFLDAGTAAPGADGQAAGLLLAPLAERPTRQLSDLLSSGRRLRIPAADLDRFLREYYPGMRQLMTVRSSDGTVELPEIRPPGLGLIVRHDPGQRMVLEWSFRYPVGADTHRLPLHESGTAGTIRDLRAERRLLADLRLPHDRLPQLREQTPDRRLAPRAELRGMDSVFFTEQVLPGLQDSADVAVEVVGTAPDYRHADSAPVIGVSATDSEDPDWFDLGITVSVDGEDVPFQALVVALAHGESHLILDSGTYFGLDRPEFDQLRRLIDEARSLTDAEGDTLRISRYQAGLWDELTELGVVEAQSRRWAATVGGLLDVQAVPPVPVPGGLHADLRPYQLEGYRWLSFLWDSGLGGILADDMGLGKTVQTLAMLCRAQEIGQLSDPVLVVAPTSVVSNWAAEAARFAPGLSVVAVTETEGKRESPLADQVAGADLVITSYALFRIDEEAYRRLPWSGLVLDEAQFVKNHQAKTYQCARRLEARFKLAITGTPLENSLMDLWSLLSIVAPGLFPSPKRFTDFYRRPIERGTDPELLATLRRRIRPLMQRRTKELVAAELPPKQEQVLEVALNPRHQKIYQTHLQRERHKVLGLVDDLDRNRFTIFRSLTLLRQLSLDPALVDEKYAGVRSSKADVFLENLREVVGEGHRALVFSQFTGFLRTIRDRLDAEGLPYVYLDGRTRNRAERIAAFKDGAAPVFLISLKAGGFGLNLTEADYCFVLDPWWNPATEAQAVDRTHRIGQDKTVMVYRLVATDTIEEKVMALKARKQDLFTRVVDDDALLSAPLTAEDIRGLFS